MISISDFLISMVAILGLAFLSGYWFGEQKHRSSLIYFIGALIVVALVFGGRL